MSIVQDVFRDGIQFTVIAGSFEFFDEAVSRCTRLEPPGLPTSFQNFEEFDFILTMIDRVQTIPANPNAFWTGLTRVGDTGGVDAAEFRFIDDVSNEFAAVSGIIPWDSSQPDNADGTERCTIINRGQLAQVLPNRVADASCVSQGVTGVVCKQFLSEGSDDSQRGLGFTDLERVLLLVGTCIVTGFSCLILVLFFKERKKAEVYEVETAEMLEVDVAEVLEVDTAQAVDVDRAEVLEIDAMEMREVDATAVCDEVLGSKPE